MKIYISPSTAGRYGGGLNGNLRYFYRTIQNALDSSGFKPSFEELCLTITYPPMYVLPGVVGIEKDFTLHYNKLPYSFLNRRYKKIDINLKAPEFSEHLDKKEQSEYEHQFDIESRFENISETKLSGILIDKFLEAGDIINSKITKKDDFDFALFQSALNALKTNISEEFLSEEAIKMAAEVKADTLNRAINAREKRLANNQIKDKRIRDFRVYASGLLNKALYPYAYQYSEIFLNILRNKNLLCPVYNHLYVQIYKSMEECLEQSVALEKWHVNGLAIIDYDNYLLQPESEKEKIVFELMSEGLRDIARLDKLDNDIIESTINEIRLKGLDTELIYDVTENKKYKLTISYFARSMEEECPIFFTLLEKTSNKWNRKQIGRAQIGQIYFWLQKVKLTPTHIKVKSSDSIAAGVYLKNKPRNLEFTINEILNG